MPHWNKALRLDIANNVTRLVNLLDFGQLFKAFGHNYFAQISYILRQFLEKVSKSLIFLVKSFFGKFYRHLAIFYWSHWFYWQNGRALWIILFLCRSRSSVDLIGKRSRSIEPGSSSCFCSQYYFCHTTTASWHDICGSNVLFCPQIQCQNCFGAAGPTTAYKCAHYLLWMST